MVRGDAGAHEPERRGQAVEEVHLEAGLQERLRRVEARRSGAEDDDPLCDGLQSAGRAGRIYATVTLCAKRSTVRKANTASGPPGVAEITTLPEAVAALVRDGDAVAMEGFTHLIPFAAGHEVLRQGRRDLELIRMTPDVLYDQLIGMGAARRLVFSYGGNPGVGSLHRFRDAIEHDWPSAIEVEEHSHAGMANRYVAGASGLPCAIMRGYMGTDLFDRTRVERVTCPFTGEALVAVPALNPDVAIVHAQEADRQGNVQVWGIPGVQKEAVLAARRSLVTVERIVDDLTPTPGGIVIPGWAVDAVAEAPAGSQPSYAHGITTRDNAFYREWDAISRDRERFTAWMEEHVLEGAGLER